MAGIMALTLAACGSNANTGENLVTNDEEASTALLKYQ